MRISPFLTLALLAPVAMAQEGVPTAEEATALQQEGRFAEAAKAWHLRAQADEDDAQAHFLYAFCLHSAGDLDAAHDAHLEAVRFPEYAARALYNHACVHALRDERDAAFTALREAIDAGFDRRDTLEGDGDLANLREDGRYAALLLELSGASRTALADLPPERRFDFYVGSWDMYDGDSLDKRLDVVSSYDGFGLRVIGTGPETGKTLENSLFLYDEDDGLWRQVWMGRDGMVIVLSGGLEEEGLALRQRTVDGVERSDARSLFTDVTPDGFTYHWQRTGDGGATWETVATRAFRRRAEG